MGGGVEKFIAYFARGFGRENSGSDEHRHVGLSSIVLLDVRAPGEIRLSTLIGNGLSFTAPCTVPPVWDNLISHFGSSTTSCCE